MTELRPFGHNHHVGGKNNTQNRRRNKNRKAHLKAIKAERARILAEGGTPPPVKPKVKKGNEATSDKSSVENRDKSPEATKSTAEIDPSVGSHNAKNQARKLKNKDKRDTLPSKAVVDVNPETARRRLNVAFDGLAEYEEVKTKAASMVEKGEVTRSMAKRALIKWKGRESRRQTRITDRDDKRMCYNCRKTGHLVSDCPLTASSPSSLVQTVGTGLCFKCGSVEHSVRQCKARVKGYPYAHCFVCNRKGHLSRECEENTKGIYPDGGCCNLCGENTHLRSDCPLLSVDKEWQPKKRREVTLGTVDDGEWVDDDGEGEVKMKAKKRKTKTVVMN